MHAVLALSLALFSINVYRVIGDIGTIVSGKRPDGKPNKIRFYSGKNGKRKDLVKQMNAWKLTHDAQYALTHKVLLEDGIVAWLETCKKPDLKPSAYDRLESIIKCLIIPRIGWRYITDLNENNIRL